VRYRFRIFKDISKYPSGVYKKDVERISEMCSKFRKWIHKKRSKIKGRLKQDPNYKCTVCKNEKLMGGNTEDKL